YDSQLVAAYQPLVGWRSRLTLGRLNAAPVAIPAFPKAVQVSVGENHAVTVSLNTGNRSFRILDDGSVPGLDAIDWLARDPRNIEFDTPDYLDGILVRAIQEDARGHLPDHPTSDDAFWSPYWRTSLSPSGLNKSIARGLATAHAHFVSFVDAPPTDPVAA